MPGLPQEATSFLAGQGWAGIVILLLISGVVLPLAAVVVFLFRKWDAARDALNQLQNEHSKELIAHAGRYAELALTASKAIETANSTATNMVAAVETFKLLTSLDRRQP